MRDLRGLRVAFVAGTLGQGGAEKQLYYMLRALKNVGAHPVLLTLTSGECWEEPIRRLGVPVEWIGIRGSRLARLGALIRAVRAYRPEILQSQHFYANPYVALAARAAGVTGVGALRSNGEWEIAANGKLLGEMCLRLPAFLVANSTGAVDFSIMRGVPAHRLHVVPNMVDAVPIPSTRSSASNNVLVLGVGRLVPIKRFDRFIRTISAVSRRGLSVRGVIAGDGPLMRELIGEAADEGLSSQALQFLGSVADTTAVFRSADVLLLTSDCEGTPNVVLEAMAAGLPVVATDVGGVRDMVPVDSKRYIVSPVNEDALADCLTDIASSRELRYHLGNQMRRHVAQHFSESAMLDSLCVLYTKCREIKRCGVV